MSFLLSLIPMKVWIALGLVAAILGGLWYYGHTEYERGKTEATAKYEAQIAAQKKAYDKKVADIKAKQQEVVTKTVIEYRDRVKVVKEKGDAIVKEVPVLVQSDCVLSGGMRVAHDAAASGVMPDDPIGAASTAPPVDPTALAETVATNYESCRQNAAQLVALEKIISKWQGK